MGKFLNDLDHCCLYALFFLKTIAYTIQCGSMNGYILESCEPEVGGCCRIAFLQNMNVVTMLTMRTSDSRMFYTASRSRD